MGVQEVLIVALFLAALGYLARIIYRNAKPKNGCGSNCKCGVDFSKLNLPDKN